LTHKNACTILSNAVIDELLNSVHTETTTHAVDRVQGYAFGIFEVSIATGEFLRNGHKIRLQGQPFTALLVLVERAGELVSRQDLQQKLWSADVVVDFEHCIGNAIRKLRDAVGDSADSPRYIETIAGRGYRFIAPVTPVYRQSHELPAHDAPPPVAVVLDSRKWPRRFGGLQSAKTLLYLAALAGVVLTGAIYVHWISTRDLSEEFRIAQVTVDSGIYPQGFRSPETLSPLAVDNGRIYASAVEQGHISLIETNADLGFENRIKLPEEVQEPEVDDISPDGTKLLVRTHTNLNMQEIEQPTWVVPTNGESAFRLPNVLSHDATWDADGKSVLLAVEHRLESVPLGGGPSHLIAELPGRAFWLRRSPDGSRLRFTVFDDLLPSASMWELRRGESTAHRLEFQEKALSSVCCGIWTSDGKYFVLQEMHESRSDLWMLPGNRISGARQITNGPLKYSSPAAGPGEQIFFEGTESISAVTQRQFDPAQNRFVSRTDFLQDAVRIVFSPDHKWVAWTDVFGHLWRSHADGSERLQLTSDDIIVLNCSWAPDDQSLALMARYPERPWQIFTLNASGGRPELLLPESEKAIGDPTFSPDGRSLAFGGLPILMGGEAYHHRPIRILDLNSRKISAVPDSENYFTPRWSPDGRYILALSLDQHKVMLYSLATHGWKTISTLLSSDPLWAPDSKSIYIDASVGNSRPLYRVSVPDGKVEKIYQPDCTDTDCVVSAITPENQPMLRVHRRRSNVFKTDLSSH